MQALELGVDSGRFAYVDSCVIVDTEIYELFVLEKVVALRKYGRRAGRGKGKIQLQPLGLKPRHHTQILAYSIIMFHMPS